MGRKNLEQINMVQFHQSYSYEDFVQGYKPSGTGFVLKDGVFHSFCKEASSDPETAYVFIIDEINRGNLSKIFGELMMLIERDKRNSDWAIPLTYSIDGSETFYIPNNLYLLGMMNTADRSLSIVDYALRRRFSFVELVPQFKSDKFRNILREYGGSDPFIETLISKLESLNKEISNDKVNLGDGFTIGHSFFCPESKNIKIDFSWYKQIVETEIMPLLSEYWFDSVEKVRAWKDKLLTGF